MNIANLRFLKCKIDKTDERAGNVSLLENFVADWNLQNLKWVVELRLVVALRCSALLGVGTPTFASPQQNLRSLSWETNYEKAQGMTKQKKISRSPEKSFYEELELDNKIKHNGLHLKRSAHMWWE